MYFDTTKVTGRRESRHRFGGDSGLVFRIPAGSRKAALVHLALAAWCAGELDPLQFGEVRGRRVDEVGLQRALYRSSMGEIEHVLGPIIKGKRILVEGHLSGTGRTAMERLGAEVEELRLEDEKRYRDMTPVIFVVAAAAMAVRYVSLGVDDQSLYILACIAFALMYGLRPLLQDAEAKGRVKVATHVVFSECCLFAASAIFDFSCEIPSVIAAAICSVLPDADYPESWLGHLLGSISEDLNRHFGHRSFFHSILALALVTAILGPLLWWLTDRPAPIIAVFIGYGAHLFADMMTLGGVQLFWPSRLIAVFPGRDEYRVVSGGNSERAFVALALILALLFYPISRVGFDGLIYRLGGSDHIYGRVTKVTDGDTVTVETQGRSTPVRLIGVDTPETVAPGQPIGCFGKEASSYTKKVLTDDLVRLEIPRIGDSEDAYGRTLAYVYLDTDKDGVYAHLFNEDLIELGLACTMTFSHTHRREFERLREEAEEHGMGLWSACPEVISY